MTPGPKNTGPPEKPAPKNGGPRKNGASLRRWLRTGGLSALLSPSDPIQGSPKQPPNAPAAPRAQRGRPLPPRTSGRGGGGFVAPDCHRGTCLAHRGEHVQWPDCEQWTPSLRPDRLEAAAPPERSERPGPPLLQCGHLATVENSQGLGCPSCRAEGMGETFRRAAGMSVPPAELLRSLESRVAATARARSEHPWGASGRPSEAQLTERILALEAELRARDFDIRGALALHQGGVQSLRRQLAEAAERADRAEHAIREHWTWGQYEFSQRRAPEIPGAGPAPEQAKDPA